MEIFKKMLYKDPGIFQNGKEENVWKMEPDIPGAGSKRIMWFIHYPKTASCCLQILQLRQ